MRATSGNSVAGWSPIVELRQYTIVPGQRDAFADLFDELFVESQADVGIRLIGQFRDIDDATRFVWLRGFDDMKTRAEQLAAFYAGPVWRAHRDTANPMMVDSDDVLLLRAARPDSVFAVADASRSTRAASDRPRVDATILHLDDLNYTDRACELFERSVVPLIRRTGQHLLGYFATEPSTNTFPALPVREGEPVFVWFCSGKQSATPDARDDVTDATTRALRVSRPPQVVRLAPTRRSLLDGRTRSCAAVPDA